MPDLVLPQGPTLPASPNPDVVGSIRFTSQIGGLIVDGQGGLVQSWVPTDGSNVFSDLTAMVRANPSSPLVVRGMPLSSNKEIVIRVGRTAAHPLILMPEDASAAAASQRWTLPQNRPLWLRAGDAVRVVNSEARNIVMTEGSPQLFAKLTGVGGGTAVTTDFTLTNLVSIPAFVAQTQMVFHFKGVFDFTHTAAATPLVELGWFVNGAVTPSWQALTPIATAGTYRCMVEGFARMSTTGPSGAWRVNMHWHFPCGASDFDRIGGTNQLVSVNTSADHTIEMRVRMQTAVAGNGIATNNGAAMLLG